MIGPGTAFGLSNAIAVGSDTGLGQVTAFGPELVSNGDFSNGDTDWIYSLTTISPGFATMEPDGGASATLENLANTGYDVGSLYRVRYDIISTTITTGLSLSGSGFTGTIAIPATIGQHEIYVVCTIEDGKLRIATSAPVNSIVVTNISVNKCLL